MKKYIDFVIAGVLVVALVAIMVLIKNGGIVNFDNNVFNLVTANENSFLENMYRVFTFLGSTTFIVGACLVIFVLFIIIKKKEIGFVIVGSVVISTIVNNVIKLIFRRERPLVRRLVEEKSLSFPSGHTMAAVTLYGILIFFVMRSKLNQTAKIAISVVLGLLPICVAVSRIYLGAHFASDVIGAAVTSSALLFVETYFIKKYYNKIVK